MQPTPTLDSSYLSRDRVSFKSPFSFSFHLGTGCGADFYSGDKGSADSPPSSAADTSFEAEPTERRRSERVKREKPDYYDALDYEHKRQKTPTRPKREKNISGSGSTKEESSQSGLKSILSSATASNRSPREERRGRPRSTIAATAASSSSGRATLTWKKGSLALSAHLAAKFNISPGRWQHVWLVAIVPPERWGKTDRNDCHTARGNSKTLIYSLHH
jgi:hypothetical protein